MSNIIDSIQLSGTTYQIQGSGGGGNPTVELTQAEYDALVTAGTVSQNTYYIITDATAGDLTQYWTSAQTQSAITSATSGKVDTSTYNTYTAATDTALASKQTTLTAGTNITIVDNVISATGGGGKAVSGGTNISITTGETADTINCTLPIVVSSFGTCLDLTYGSGNDAKGSRAITLGAYTKTTNSGELAIGRYNVSNTTSTSPIYNNPDKTVFSVGNGTAERTRHNAFEIRQNGDIYLNDGTNDVKLQDKFSSIETTIGDINTILQSI